MKIFLEILAVIAFLLYGCGPEDHSPRIRCTNWGIENVRRNIRFRVSIQVDRPPLTGISSETVKLLALPSRTQVPGSIYYSGERIIFTPSEHLDDSANYVFEILDGIADAGGAALPTVKQEFWTGNLLQVYFVDLWRNYDLARKEVYSIAIYFTEAVDEASLYWGESSITVYSEPWVPQYFEITYYDDVALAVLIFDSPLEVGNNYTLSLHSNIRSANDAGYLDGDRDGTEIDLAPFVLNFSYEDNPNEGFIVADSSTTAMPYYEPIERCFLSEFD